MRLPVILIHAHLDFPTAVRSMQYGALTVLEKPYQADQLTDAIREGMRRNAERRQEEADRRRAHERYAQLTARERTVLKAVVQGTPVKVIARQQGLGPQAVGEIRGELFKKLGVDSLVALARVHTEIAEAVAASRDLRHAEVRAN